MKYLIQLNKIIKTNSNNSIVLLRSRLRNTSKKKKKPFDYSDKGEQNLNNESKSNPFSLKNLDPE